MLEGIFAQTILLVGAAVYGWLINTLMKQCYESNTPFRSSRRQLVQATLLFHVAMFCWIQFSMSPQLQTTAAVHASALLATVASVFLLVWRYRRQGVLKRKRKHRKPQEVWKDSWQVCWTPNNLPLNSHREHSAHAA